MTRMIENGDKATVESFSDLSSILQSPNHCREPGTLGRHVADRCSTMLTMLTKATTGTPHYMSPEMVAWLDLHGMTRSPSEPFGSWVHFISHFSHFSHFRYVVKFMAQQAMHGRWECVQISERVSRAKSSHESERQEHSEIDMLNVIFFPTLFPGFCFVSSVTCLFC